jgi:anti-sigma B factor antagonist
MAFLRDRRVGGVTVIDVEALLPSTETPLSLLDYTKALLQRGDRQIVVNLARVPRSDSAFLGQLIESYRTAVRHRCVFKIAQPTSHLTHQLRVTHFDSLLETFSSEADAIASFAVEPT